jgi:hypothetical protein
MHPVTHDSNPDRILPVTRVVAGVVIPFLILAFMILYLTPSASGDRFAWEIKPNMTAAFMGAGYLGGSWLFIQTLFGKNWHRVAPGFPAVTAFTWAMLIVTILHWERFDLRHFPFQLWFGLYILTPFLVPGLWLLNRRAAGTHVMENYVRVPQAARLAFRGLGFFLLAIGLLGIVYPQVLTATWPWSLTPLTARVLAGWLTLLGVGGIVIGGERRWSAWRVGMESIAIWHVLILAAGIINRKDFHSGPFNWYMVSVFAVLTGMLGLYLYMELLTRNQRRQGKD